MDVLKFLLLFFTIIMIFRVCESKFRFEYNPVQDLYMDESSGEISIINLKHFSFFGKKRYNAAMNWKGFLSLSISRSTYVSDLDLDKVNDLVAPFYSNITTMYGGKFWQGVRTDEKSMSEMRNLLSKIDRFDNVDSINVVTWQDVAHAESREDNREKNSFQVVLASDSGTDESFVYIKYEQIEWTMASQKYFQLPIAALADKNSQIVLPFSSSLDIRQILRYSNIGLPGEFLFRVTDEYAPSSIKEIREVTPYLNCAQAIGFCSKYSTCLDTNGGGFCCGNCPLGFIGNGFNCIDKVKFFQSSGGNNADYYTLYTSQHNRLTFNNFDLKCHSSAYFTDRLAYFGISDCGENNFENDAALKDLQPVIAVGFVFYALHAGGKAILFDLTGGRLNRSLNVEYTNKPNNFLKVQQEFLADDDNYPYVITKITGKLDEAISNPKQTYSANINQIANPLIYRRSGKGHYVLTTILHVTNDITGEKILMNIKDEIRFHTCLQDKNDAQGFEIKWENMFSQISETNYKQNLWFGFMGGEVKLMTQNACKLQGIDCGVNGTCDDSDPNRLSCKCNAHYQPKPIVGYPCVDIDECFQDYICDSNAVCTNTIGGVKCDCKAGYVGDGFNCELENTQYCGDKVCGENEECDKIRYQCVCKQGFVFDSSIMSCVSSDLCGNTRCNMETEICGMDINGYKMCQCKPGYVGSAGNCYLADPCVQMRCYENEICKLENGQPKCVCKPGYTGSAGYCYLADPCVQMKCYENEICMLENNQPKCVCKAGYEFVNNYCQPKRDMECPAICQTRQCEYVDERVYCVCRDSSSGDVNCDNYPDKVEICDEKPSTILCHKDAFCRKDPQPIFCTCNAGFEGDGINCVRSTNDKCRSDADCFENSKCLQVNGIQDCVCNSGYFLANGKCNRETPSKCDKICDLNQECFMDSTGYQFCRCIQGYILDNMKCKKLCGGNYLCHDLATCVSTNNEEICKCNGLGDGVSFCYTVEPDCRYDIKLCNYYLAECNSQTGSCICGPDYYRETQYEKCKPKPYNCHYFPNICPFTEVCRLMNSEYKCDCKDGFRRNERNECEELPYPIINNLLLAREGSIYNIPVSFGGGGKFNVTKNLIKWKKREYRVRFYEYQIVTSVAYDCSTKNFYYGVYGKALLRYNVNNDTITELLNARGINSYDFREANQFMRNIEGLAYDWSAKNLFYTDKRFQIVAVINVSNKKVKIIAEKHVKRPRGIDIDPTMGLVFWTDWDSKRPRIERMNMDGTDRKTIIKLPKRHYPNGIVLDKVFKRLCFCDAHGRGSIYCADYDGRNQQVYFEKAKFPYSILLIRRNLVWTSWETKSIQSIPLDGLAPESSIEIPTPNTGSRKPYGISPITETCERVFNPCENYNCPDKICLPSNGRANCVCPTDQKC